MQNARLDKYKLESRLLGEISINNLRYAEDTTLMEESEEELKNLLINGKEETEKADKTQHSKNYDHGIQSHHFMARWRNNINDEILYFPGL